ncbi:MAG TPA: PspC domain-containing protein [Streptosporangiaceae bacterium]|nr:PspC domain-containing protein [Streptosporangiaceae bacterium]
MNTTAIPQESDQTTASPGTGGPAGPEPLCRPIEGRMLAGVAAGIARYFGADVTVMRLVLAVLTLVGGAAVPAYLAGWLLIPEEGAAQSIAADFFQSLSARAR